MRESTTVDLMFSFGKLTLFPRMTQKYTICAVVYLIQMARE